MIDINRWLSCSYPTHARAYMENEFKRRGKGAGGERVVDLRQPVPGARNSQDVAIKTTSV